MKNHGVNRSLLQRATIALAFSASCLPVPGMALEAVSDDELAGATGQEGIGMQMELRINADQFGRALSSGNPGDRGMVALNSGDFANCGSTTDFSSTGCRLALKFSNQDSWLVAKNFYGRIVMPLVYIDAGFTPVSSTPYVDLTRFKGRNGAPLLASPNDMSLVKLSFPKEIEVWNLTIGGLSMESGATGYLNNAGGSVGGIKISNSVPDMPATINLQGSIGIFGF